MSQNQPKSEGKTGGTIGDLSIAIGRDVRELFIDGYSQAQVLAVAQGKMTLAEMIKEGPQNEPIDTQEVIDRIRKRRKQQDNQ